MAATTEPHPRQGARHWLAVAVLATATLVCYKNLLLTPGGLIHPPVGRNNDALRQYLGQRVLVGEELRSGHLPNWDPHAFAGRPVIANPQTAVFYPGTWLFALSPGPAVFSWNMALHTWLLAVGVYVVALHYGLPFLMALLAGVLAAAAPYYAGHVQEGHLPHVSSATWYPWLLWAYERVVDRTGSRRRSVGLLALFAALCLLAGHGQEVYYAALGLGLLVVVDTVRGIARRGIRWLATHVILLATAAVLAVAIAAAQLLPQLATLPYTVRSGALPLRLAWSFSTSLQNLVQLVLPLSLGCSAHDNYRGPWNYWEANLGLGLVAAVFAVLGAITGLRHRGLRRALLLCVFAVWFALGKEGRLFEVLYEFLPGVALFRAPGRMLFWFGALIPVLIAAGVWWLTERLRLSERLGGANRLVVPALVAWTIGGVLALTWPQHCGVDPLRSIEQQSLTVLDYFVTVLGLVGVVVAVSAVTVAVLRSTAVAIPAITGGCWLAVQVLLIQQTIALATHLLPVLPRAKALTLTTADRFKVRLRDCPEQPCRVLALPSYVPDTDAVLVGLEKLTGYDAFQFKHVTAPLLEAGGAPPEAMFAWYDRDLALTRVTWSNRALDAWAVHLLLVTPEWLERRFPERPGWYQTRLFATEALALSQVTVLRRLQPAPRVRLYSSPQYTGFSSAAIAIVDGTVLPGGKEVRVTYERDRAGRAGRWRISVQCPIPARLELAEPWAPGMTAEVNGKPAAIRLNYWGQVAVDLEPGQHEVVVRYRPPLLLPGLALSSLGLLVLAALVAPVPFARSGRDRITE